MPTAADAARLVAAMDAVLALPSPIQGPAPQLGAVLHEISAHWVDRSYQPATDGAWVDDPAAAAALTVGGMRRALTFYMRAERFSEGFHRFAAGPDGLGRLRARLAVLLDEDAFTLPACFSPPDSTWALA